MRITPVAQALFEDVVMFLARGADRPCGTWTPYADTHERFKVTVCSTCKFPEGFHLLARVLGLIQSGELTDPPWDEARSGHIGLVWQDLRRMVAQKASVEQVDALLLTLRGYALEARPPGAFEKDAAAILRALQGAAKGIDSKELQAVVTSATDWLDRYDRETVEVQP